MSEVEVLVDDLVMYAHVDSVSGEAVVAHVPDTTAEILRPIYRELVERGFVRVSASWHDSDWKRDMHVLIKAEG